MNGLSEETLCELYVSTDPDEIPKLVERLDRLQNYMRAIRREAQKGFASNDATQMRRALGTVALWAESALPEG